MIKKRLIALIIDYAIVALLGFVAIYVNIILSVPISIYAAITSLSFAYLFSKDSFTGQSIGRRIMNISLVDKNSGEVLNPYKALVRNIFLMIWPIEFIVLLVKGERLGDIITNCKIINYKVTQKISFGGVLIFILLWVIFYIITTHLMTRGLTSILFL